MAAHTAFVSQRPGRALVTLLACCTWGSSVASAQVNTTAAPERVASGFVAGQQRSWFFWSVLPDTGDQKADTAETLGIEFENYVNVGRWHVKNLAYVEVDVYPRPIPGQPNGNPSPGTDVRNGINDLLTGFWLSRQGEHHGKHHFSVGPAFQFPTASDDTLGSGKWSAGPTIDYEYASGRLFAGVIALNLWSFAGKPERKRVNMFMAKPFLVYQATSNWDVIYMPYGVSIYWDKPKGEKAYVPLGGGVQRHFRVGSFPLNISGQVFNNVIRPSKGTKWDVRFMVELVFNST